MAASPASPFWVLLGSKALVSEEDGISLSLKMPPRVVHLTVPRSMLPVTTTNVSVVAAYPSGILLHADGTPSVIDRPEGSDSDKSGSVGCYYLLDTEFLLAIHIPNPGPEYSIHPSHLGYLASPQDTDSYLVAGLQPPAVDGKEATLLYFSDDHDWDQKRLSYPLPASPPLAPHGVVSHSGRLWWVDLFRCLLTCDPFADAPILAVVHRPPGKSLRYKEHRSSLLQKRRRVAASGGQLLLVDMYKNKDSEGARRISVWSLTGADSTWKLEWEVPFLEIWNHRAYRDSPLPRKTPILMLVHPVKPRIIYFSVDEYLFGVDLSCRSVVEIGSCMLAVPSSDHVVAHLVHAWQPPINFQHFHIDDIGDDSSDEDNWSENSDVLTGGNPDADNGQ